MQGRWPHSVFSSGGRGPGFPQFIPEQSTVHPHANSTIPFNPFMNNGIFPAHNAILPSGNLVYPNYGTVFQPEVHGPPREAFERIDKVVSKCHADLLAAGETVSSCKVSQAALFELQAVSWESLGFRMQQIPSLFSLMATEGKINAFIHCFIVVRGIATLHDLEVSICKNEGVEKFEQLEFGPLTRHPLVIHYFSHGSELDGVLKISSGEVISYLSEFMEIQKRKHIKADGFLNFIAKKQSVQTKDQLGVLIQNLGDIFSSWHLFKGHIHPFRAHNLRMYVSYVGEAKDGEDASVKKCLISHKRKSTQSGHKKRRRLFPSLKKNLDDRFKVMSDRVQSFASEHDNFCGKHIRFVSSSSNDDNSSDAYGTEDEMDVKGSNNQCSILPHTAETSEKLSACPYPSATEEMTRLKMKSGTGDASSLDSKSGHSGNRSGIGKRSRFLKRRKIEEKNLTSSYEYNFSLSESSQRIFITTWKEACRELDVSEVLERMIQFLSPSANETKRIRKLFATPTFIALLNIAVKSIKYGMWDSIYDAFQDVGDCETAETKAEIHTDYEVIDVGSPGKSDIVVTNDSSTARLDVSPASIISKIAPYFEFDDLQCDEVSTIRKRFMTFKKFSNCEDYLAEQFAVSHFSDLGYGDFCTFIEKHACMLPDDLLRCLNPNLRKVPLEVLMHEQQLVLLLSQALHGFFGNENTVCKEGITTLLMRQFPSVCFKAIEHECLESFVKELRVQKNFAVSNRLLFSQALSGTNSTITSMDHDTNNKYNNSKHTYESEDMKGCWRQNTIGLGSVTSEHATETLLKAPMLSDLSAWSHWDLIFAPHLGPLVEWLLRGGDGNKLMCLMTKDGKIIRIDDSATVDSFFEVLLEGCPYRTAVKLISLFSLFGGRNHIPLSLLKSFACKAFDVILKRPTKYSGQDIVLDFHTHGISQSRPPGESLLNCYSGDTRESAKKVNKGVSCASKFILECLCYLPLEFRDFAADVLLSALHSVVKDASSVILHDCDDTLQRTMLHGIGISLGVGEWINDYHLFHSSFSFDSLTCLQDTKSSSAIVNTGSGNMELKKMDSSMENIYQIKKIQKSSSNEALLGGPEFSVDNSSNSEIKNPSELDADLNAFSVIESIRREEFGLDSSLRDSENSMLKKQHARLGRALHCLSQELYSQDSHFILELIQNADDNLYPENEEPTLAFIVQEKAIIVLNNERGFSAHNIKALCDVGNSTKKDSTAGYIGQKGIGFKSVFRVTDAPEIHSNGFHVKFDISEGQIGFVLPTIIPPCDVSSFKQMVPDDEEGPDCWNTCIVLPFRSKFSEEFAMNNVVSMFSDLHPSLLLFLHRLQCIKLRNIMNDTLLIMRKESLGSGIVKVSTGEENMYWFVVSRELNTDVIRPAVQMTEISIAFTLLEAEGQYAPHLKQQPVFAFLPLRNYGLKFIIQGDFVLPSSREEVDVNSSWNQWLLSEFPALFVSAEELFCSLPCFEGNPGKAVTTFMSFVPLVGEVHGFFSALPRMIISRLCLSDCMLVEGEDRWVPPCKVLRNWNEQARSILSDKLLYEHLGFSYLDKDIILPDSLASALRIEDYGPKILVQVMSSLCKDEGSLMSMGLAWICHWVNALYSMYLYYESQPSIGHLMEFDLINNLRTLPFIPLADGTYGSIKGGTIWMHSDVSPTRSVGCDHQLEAFPNLYAKLRIVNTSFVSVAATVSICEGACLAENVTRMLHRIGVRKLTTHEILKLHILPGLSSCDPSHIDNNLIIEFLSFAMFHLQSECSSCMVEKGYVISELRKAMILTSHGYKRPVEESIHFSKDYGNPVDISRIICTNDLVWYELDIAYLKHPVTRLISCGMTRWREFFKKLGVNDFVQVIEVKRDITDMQPAVFKRMTQNDCNFISCSSIIDWESEELSKLLSVLSVVGDRVKSSYLLEIFDILWDEYFSDKVTAHFSLKPGENVGSFKSSFITSICETKWVTSNVDLKLYCPKDLFNECDEVVSILGMHAPYARPKVTNGKLMTDIGFKTSVTLEDTITMFHIWRKAEKPFMASIAQMSRFYTYVWKEMDASRGKIMEVLSSGPFIFVPFASGSKNDGVLGTMLSPDEVYWDNDIVSSKQQPLHNSITSCPLSKALCSLYPALHDFFVNECGVPETVSFQSTTQFLLELSSFCLPSQAANMVSQVFCKWADQLSNGFLCSKDISYLRESLTKSEFTILPTALDKWVSLNPTFGLVCWCDDGNLRKEFRYKDGIDFLYFDALNDRQDDKIS